SRGPGEIRAFVGRIVRVGPLAEKMHRLPEETRALARPHSIPADGGSDAMSRTSPALRPVGPCAIVIFGAAGDLTRRKLLAALYYLKANGLLNGELAIIGVARRPLTSEEFRVEMSEELRRFATREVDERLWSELRDRLYYHAGDFAGPETYDGLARLLKE